MPTMANSSIPAPREWNEFEDIVASCLRIRWENKNLSRIGRKGQVQHGVDIYGNDDLGRKAGVQCKLIEGELNLKVVVSEVLKAENFVPYLDIYYIATTASRDAKLQRDIRMLSEHRKEEHKFPIQMLFWEDLIQDLATDLMELNKHYPELNLRTDIEKNKRRSIQINNKIIKLFLISVLLILLYIWQPVFIRDVLNYSSIILFENLVGLILYSILIGFIVIVLRISDSKFNKEIKESYQPKIYESKEKTPISTKVFDDNFLDNGEWRVLREVRILNTTGYDIKNIVGKVIFYDNHYKVDEIPFIEDVILSRKGIRIDKLVEHKKEANWNEFHTEIISMESNKGPEKNIKIYGTYIIRTHFLLLNRYNYIRVFGKRILPYEITWLRSAGNDLWDRLMFMPSSWGATGINKGLFWIRLRRRLMQVTAILLLVCCSAYTIGSFIIMVIKLVVCWYNLATVYF
ncbi:hypothetical protein PPOLYM_01373 [Paenibacillus polymyxa]|uniref:hypothetical protein n=1 Tax=Paenibacillus TaxID=44249 RepID=UPI0009481021|nr:hypothetical protein [Paenibacillus polymyxa]VUG04996.1 hypothetical protein PPOLYM_01373 [Paenibacillus polymyxa]